MAATSPVVSDEDDLSLSSDVRSPDSCLNVESPAYFSYSDDDG